MTAASISSLRADFAEREASLHVFDIFSGTGTPGEDGTPDMPGAGEEDPGLSVSDIAAISTFGALGLTGASYALMRYGAARPVEPVLEPMKFLYQKIQIGKAIEAAQDGKGVTKLMELMPYVGTPVKRMNIDALWGQVAARLEDLQKLVDGAETAMNATDATFNRLETVGRAGFITFGSLSLLGATATGLTAAFHDRAVPLVDDVDAVFDGLDARAARRVDKALSEFGFRSDQALGGIDATIADIGGLVGDLPDFDALRDQMAEFESLFDPIGAAAAEIAKLVKPAEDFLNVAQIIGAPIEGVFQLFENPPKILPIIVGYEEITPGFWLTVPDPIWSDPFRTKQVWIEPVRIPIPGFTELFDPIPRSEVQKIIDLILSIAGLPQQLLEEVLAPILTPIQNEIDKILQPILDELNPFADYLDDYTLARDAIEGLRAKLDAVVADLQAAIDRVADAIGDLDPIEEIGAPDAAGMATFFGGRAGERIVGDLADESGGFLGGALLQGNGGDDEILGTRAADFLGGGGGKDVVKAGGGADVVLGGSGDDDLAGGDGADVILGGDGDDRIGGGGGADRIYGGDGEDVISGDEGRDVLSGGDSADRFVFASVSDLGKSRKGADLLLDFTPGEDVIDLRRIDATPDDARDGAFAWRGETRNLGRGEEGAIAFRKIDRPGRDLDETRISIDLDGDRGPEAIIRLSGLVDLGAGDVLL